ncbi:MAG: flagellar hook-length control protein FliK [Deltaproteobacteria bacterium]|nr:flagellar hook-length control protein FliK [Deltaproteobacteria bacterium]MBN2673705.1 flagellar hook-length control protein FliK [Deltaproteobacteria bacterium]
MIPTTTHTASTRADAATLGVRDKSMAVESGAFSFIFEEESNRGAQGSAEMYGDSTDAGNSEKRRHFYHPLANNSGRNVEKHAVIAVNSADESSENCQNAAGRKNSDGETAEQQFSNNGSNHFRRRHQRAAAPVPNSITNNCNHSAISHTAPILTNTSGSTTAAIGAGFGVPNEEMKKLVRVLRNSSLSKRTSVFLTLDLKQLGEVKLDVTLKAKKVYINASISDRRAAAALSYAVSELKQQLAAIDLTLEHFEVQTGGAPRRVNRHQAEVSATVAVH